MTFHDWLTAREIGSIFVEEIDAVGGRVTETIEADPLLFARSILPEAREVGKGDLVQGGVALRATDQEILVHPYIFRQVCSNGAIRAQAIQTQQIRRGDFPEFAGENVACALREAVRMSCGQVAFHEGVDEMRSARLADADLALALIPLLVQTAPEAAAELFQSIMRQHTLGRDRTRFGLMNAVTSVARDTRDPELRWRLEEFGGGIPVAVAPRHPRLEHQHAWAMSLV
jgi:hypothetical protein